MALTAQALNVIVKDGLAITGSLAMAIVDTANGLALGHSGHDVLDLDQAASGNAEVLRAELSVMKSLGVTGPLEDILVILSNQYHLIRPLSGDNSVFFYLILDRERSNLAFARRALMKLEQKYLTEIVCPSTPVFMYQEQYLHFGK
jgi:hypothetical protein